MPETVIPLVPSSVVRPCCSQLRKWRWLTNALEPACSYFWAVLFPRITLQVRLPGQSGAEVRKRGAKSNAKSRLESVIYPSVWDCSMEAYQRAMRNAGRDNLQRTPHAVWLATTTRTGSLRASARRLDLMGRAMRWSFHRFLTRTWYD
jgi:hypothetical protein